MESSGSVVEEFYVPSMTTFEQRNWFFQLFCTNIFNKTLKVSIETVDQWYEKPKLFGTFKVRKS